ncbi:tripartite tricarboxylate transporter TctB family protein [Caballeronia sp. dw_19]|uniref:tripartite tricarboxylate transporter TctB family protein n=1 Tax=Caballeronia sp. dw_19 TaxID=2719791 RepID=UPI001BD324BB|nr:tripartite tricarboxylate transporter TctB family protein [Caballeronia sp. dw_19]
MRQRINLSKDHYGAVLLMVMGLGILVQGVQYRTGSLTDMGAGFVPVVLGAILMLVGAAIGLKAGYSTEDRVQPAHPAAAADTPGETAVPQGTSAPGTAVAIAERPVLPEIEHRPFQPQWRGWLCVLGGLFAFVGFGIYGGFVPATLGCTFIAALGDKKNSVRDAALLAVAMLTFTVLVFHWGLRLQLPLFSWG